MWPRNVDETWTELSDALRTRFQSIPPGTPSPTLTLLLSSCLHYLDIFSLISPPTSSRKLCCDAARCHLVAYLVY